MSETLVVYIGTEMERKRGAFCFPEAGSPSFVSSRKESMSPMSLSRSDVPGVSGSSLWSSPKEANKFMT